MGLFSKKDIVPDLPPAPTLPELPRKEQRKSGLPELPSFPQSSKNDNLNREIVKSAVSDDLTPEEEEVRLEFPPMKTTEEKTPLLPPRIPARHVIEPPRRIVRESMPQIEAPRALEISESNHEEISERQMSRPSEPIFVRIDKFQASQESFDKILSKVKEIENTLDKIRKVKVQEEEELNKWASEVEQLKSRLSDIDSNIFSQI